MLSARVIGVLLVYALQVLIARVLGTRDYGIFVFAWTIVTVLAYLAPLGFDIAAVKYISNYLTRGEWARIRNLIVSGERLTIVCSVIIAGFIFFMLQWPTLTSTEFGNASQIAILAIPFMALSNAYEGAARGFGWPGQVYFPMYVIRPLLILIGVVAATLVIDISTASCLVIAVGATITTWAWQRFRLQRSLVIRLKPSAPIPRSYAWLRTSLPLVVVSSFELLQTNTDIVMVSALRGATETGLYNAGARTAGLVVFVHAAIGVFAARLVAARFSSGQNLELIALARMTRRWSALSALAGLLILTVAGKWILNLFGPAFVDSYTVMIILCVGLLIRTCAGPVDLLLTMTGKERTYAITIGCVVGINIVLNFVLIGLYGFVGAAIATLLSIALEVIVISHIAGTHIGFVPFLLKAT